MILLGTCPTLSRHWPIWVCNSTRNLSGKRALKHGSSFWMLLSLTCTLYKHSHLIRRLAKHAVLANILVSSSVTEGYVASHDTNQPQCHVSCYRSTYLTSFLQRLQRAIQDELQHSGHEPLNRSCNGRRHAQTHTNHASQFIDLRTRQHDHESSSTHRSTTGKRKYRRHPKVAWI